MKTTRFPWIAVTLLLAAPSVLRAQEASFESPNGAVGCTTDRNVPMTTPGGGAKMIVRVRPADLPAVKADVVLAPCDSGYVVALKIMDAIHAAAVDPDVGYACSAPFGICGGAVAGGGAPRQDWQFTQPSGDGFSLTKFPGAGTNVVHVAGVGASVPDAIAASTNAGNTVGLDLLNRYLVQVIPNGFNAVVTFRAFHLQGGQNPKSFTINTAIFPDLTALLNAIKAGFDNMRLGFSTSVVPSALATFPDAFVPGPVVLISNAQVAASFEVVGAPGQLIAHETSSPGGLLGLGGAKLDFALMGVVPNPGRGFHVSFSLPDAQPATLAVFDVSGREVSVLQVGSLGAGRHVVSVGAGTLPPGVYLVRLVQANRQLIARAVVR